MGLCPWTQPGPKSFLSTAAALGVCWLFIFPKCLGLWFAGNNERLVKLKYKCCLRRLVCPTGEIELDMPQLYESILNTGLAMICYHSCKPRKMEAYVDEESLPQYKAVWTDITSAKFSVAHLKFILIGMAELISNWLF